MVSRNSKNNIKASIYRLDTNLIEERFGKVKIENIPQTLVGAYNKTKEDNKGRYTPIINANQSKFSKINNLSFFEKEQATFVTHRWVNFFNKESISLGNKTTAIPHLACFILLNNEYYALTTGSAYVVFEQFIDQTFPIEIAKRMFKPEVKGGKQQAISGIIQATDIYFRRPTRVGVSNSYQEVWKNLSGDIKKSVLKSNEFKDIFGNRKKTGAELKSSVTINAQIENPKKLLKLIRWIASKENETVLENPFPFFESIRPLSPRRDRIIIEKLSLKLCDDLLASKIDTESMTLSHEEISKFINADRYIIGSQVWEHQPSIDDVVLYLNKDQSHTNTEFMNLLKTTNLKAQHSEDEWRTKEASIFNHLSGEYRVKNELYYLLNGSWFKVEKSFLEITDQELKSVLDEKKYTELSHTDLNLKACTQKFEPSYNENQKGNKMIWADEVFYKNIEIADLIGFKDKNYVDIIHNKIGINAKTRDLVSQIRNSINLVENTLRLNENRVFKDYYEELKRKNRIYNINVDDFISLFQRERRYILGYIDNKKLESGKVKKIQSSIAKNELVALIDYSRRLSSSRASLKLVQIPT